MSKWVNEQKGQCLSFPHLLIHFPIYPSIYSLDFTLRTPHHFQKGAVFPCSRKSSTPSSNSTPLMSPIAICRPAERPASTAASKTVTSVTSSRSPSEDPLKVDG